MPKTLMQAPQALPLAPWLGGKRNLAKRLTAILDNVDHSTYAEPFTGMGGVFFRRKRMPKGEVLNDISRDIITLFRVLQRHYVPFVEMLRWQLTSRAEFERLLAVPPETLTDMERAARFIYLQRLAFGGKVARQTYGAASDRPARFDPVRLLPMLEDAHDRLSRVTLECLPWDVFLPRYDRAGTIFYLDPPYWGHEGDYGPGIFSRDDFAKMADMLKGLSSRWVLSINDRPEIRTLFKGCPMEAVEVTYTAGVHSGHAKRAGELIICSDKGLLKRA